MVNAMASRLSNPGLGKMLNCFLVQKITVMIDHLGEGGRS